MRAIYHAVTIATRVICDDAIKQNHGGGFALWLFMFRIVFAYSARRLPPNYAACRKADATETRGGTNT